MSDTSLEVRGDREIVIARTFRASPRAVFDAWTRPELVERWWAPRSLGVSVVRIEADVRAGGGWRYVLKNAEPPGEYAFSGRYVEVDPPSRLVYTQAFEPAGPHAPETVVTVTFEGQKDTTRVVSTTLCPSREVRDGILASGMEHGMRETMNQLDELVATLR